MCVVKWVGVYTSGGPSYVTWDDCQVGLACTRYTNILFFTTFKLYRVCIGWDIVIGLVIESDSS